MKSLFEYIIESQNDKKVYANMILLNHDETKVLILQRAWYMKKFKGQWGFPGGSVDNKDKDSKEAAIRELQEETGIELTWNEKNNIKKYDMVTNEDGSVSEYYITHLELENLPYINISKEHAKYEWFNSESDQKKKWMPDIFKIIQKIL